MKRVFLLSSFLILMSVMTAQSLSGIIHDPFGNWHYIFATDIDANGRIYAANDNSQVAYFDGTIWMPINSDGQDFEEPRALAAKSPTDIWLGTSDKGLFHFDGTTWTNFNKSNSAMLDDWVYDLEIMPNGTVFGSTFKGLIQVTNNVLTFLTTSNSQIPTSSCEGLLAEGNFLWIGCNGFLAKKTGSSFQKWPTIGQASWISKEPNGFVLLAEGFDGIEAFEPNLQQFLVMPNEMKNANSSCIINAPSGSSLFSEHNYGLKIIENDGKVTGFDFNHPLIITGQFSEFLKDANGHIWASGAAGQILEITNINLVNATEPTNLGFQIFPQPADAAILFSENEIENIALIDAFGKTVFSKKGAISRIETAHLPSGFYALKGSTRDGDFVQKAVIQH